MKRGKEIAAVRVELRITCGDLESNEIKNTKAVALKEPGLEDDFFSKDVFSGALAPSPVAEILGRHGCGGGPHPN